ncbi:hypothetical protein [Acinetobacter baumannii]|uniref:hypothetical protein n=1 Tax=Acinetobacter baumannii TaxID=470 RepID=UPI001864F823|nr:hypothetical protein [Acinetobacter baumannii]HCW5914777.1 hypothetical protein [Acinetobacter baumannii]
MLKMNLIYPVIKTKGNGTLSFHSKDFNLHVEAESVPEGIRRIKDQMVLKITEISKNGNPLPDPDLELDEPGVIYIEIDSSLAKYRVERVNMTIPVNQLKWMDDRSLNRSNYVSELIWEDMKRQTK